MACLVLFALVAGAGGLARAWRAPAAVVPALAAYPLCLLLLNFSGLIKGETSRVWLFLAPGLVWAGAAELVRRSGDRWRLNLAVLLLAQYGFLYLCYTTMHFYWVM